MVLDVVEELLVLLEAALVEGGVLHGAERSDRVPKVEDAATIKFVVPGLLVLGEHVQRSLDEGEIERVVVGEAGERRNGIDGLQERRDVLALSKLAMKFRNHI